MLKTRENYDAAFEHECTQDYPAVTALEKELGYAIDADRLLSAARVLACPVKVNPPNWQHGRVLYAAACDYFSRSRGVAAFCALDIGTAKGFSALMVRYAALDMGVPCRVHSCDVVRPDEPQWRNTVLECGRDVPLTLPETLAAFPAASDIVFYGMSGAHWLMSASPGHVHFAFVDGKHSGHVVRQEAQMLASQQEQGDVIVFDDVHIPDVRSAAWSTLGNAYERRVIQVLPKRAYMLCRRK